MCPSGFAGFFPLSAIIRKYAQIAAHFKPQQRAGPDALIQGIPTQPVCAFDLGQFNAGFTGYVKEHPALQLVPPYPACERRRKPWNRRNPQIAQKRNPAPELRKPESVPVTAHHSQ
jgi:hypothetical protein